MGRLIYVMPASLDGFISDEDYSWSAPSGEVMAALAADTAERSTFLYGRRMYETMAVWDGDVAAAQSAESAQFAAAWQAADKIVFSSTLTEVHTGRTRLERRLDGQVVAEIKTASRGDLTIAGPRLAAEALRLDLVDVVEMLWCPTLLGGGIPVLSAGVRRDLTLRKERRFGNGMVQATYDVTPRQRPSVNGEPRL